MTGFPPQFAFALRMCYKASHIAVSFAPGPFA